MTCETKIEEIRARIAKTPLPPLFDWDEDTLRIAYLNGGLARATYEMQCRYVGRDHEGVSIRIIEDSIRTAVRADIEMLVNMLEHAMRSMSQERVEKQNYGDEWMAGYNTAVAMINLKNQNALAYLDRLARDVG